MYLRSRMYSPSIGKFTTRDIWAGDEKEPISFNHWSYAYSQPINNIDPSGYSTIQQIFANYVDDYDNNNKMASRWTNQEIYMVNQALGMIAFAYADAYNKKAADEDTIIPVECNQWLEKKLAFFAPPKSIDPIYAFLRVHGGKVTVWKHTGNAPAAYGGAWGTGLSGHQLDIWAAGHFDSKLSYLTKYGEFGMNVAVDNYERFITHEMGHVFDHAIGDKARTEIGKAKYSNLVIGGYTTANGFCGPKIGFDANTWQGWQWRFTTGPEEYFADMFVSWVYGCWEPLGPRNQNVLTERGQARSDFMNEHMPTWIFEKVETR